MQPNKHFLQHFVQSKATDTRPNIQKFHSNLLFLCPLDPSSTSNSANETSRGHTKNKNLNTGIITFDGYYYLWGRRWLGMFWEGTPKGTNHFVMFFKLVNKSLLFMIKNLDSHVPLNYYLLTPHGWIPNENCPMHTHTPT